VDQLRVNILLITCANDRPGSTISYHFFSRVFWTLRCL